MSGQGHGSSEKLGRPLEGYRVLDWTVFQQGPIAACLLADMGADVIKIEPPEGEAARGVLRLSGIDLPVDFYYQNQNRGKRGITLDLKKEKAREVLYRLVEHADVFVTNYRESACRRVKADYETLKAVNPKLIYAYASGYGPLGPDADLASADFAAQARGGLWSVSRGRDMSWVPIGAAMADEAGGLVCAYGITMALLVRERTGIGQRVDTSLLSAQIELVRLSLQQFLMGSKPAPSTLAWATSPLYNLYECQDGKWICLSVQQADRFWARFCEALEVPELANDPRFATIDVRRAHFDELMPRLREVFMTRNRDEWVKRMREAGVEQMAPVQDCEDLSKDPQVLANNYIVEVDDPIRGRVRTPGICVQLSETPGKVTRLAPELGQHTEEVLLEAGYTWEDITALREAGAF